MKELLKSSCSYDMSYGNIIARLVFKIQLVEIIGFTKTTEAAASVASNVATAMASRDRRIRYSLPITFAR